MLGRRYVDGAPGCDLCAISEFVGVSEQNVRKALRLAEAVSPCVLWMDEIEKGLSTGSGDGGTSMRVFATMLSWMQEKTAPVFLVATANEIELLPPEVLRRGRFDEIFFLDLPTAMERKAIFAVHIRKRGRDPGDYDLIVISSLRTSSGCRAMTWMVFFLQPVLTRTFTGAICGALLWPVQIEAPSIMASFSAPCGINAIGLG